MKAAIQHVAAWEDVRYSGKYVAGLNAVVLAAHALPLSPLALMLTVAGIAFLVGFALSRFLGWRLEGPSELLSEGGAQRVAENMRQTANTLYNEARSIFYWTNTRLSVIVTVCCFVAARLLTIFSVPLVALILADGYLLRKPATQLYAKHGEKIVKPYLEAAQHKAEQMLKNVPSLQEMITALSTSGKNKKI